MRLFEPETEAAPPGPLRRVMLLVAYDGSTFHGFAPQPGRRTAGGLLCETLSQMAGHAVALTCAGRTDAGVHATGQVVHVDLDETAVRRFSEGDGPLLAGASLWPLARSLSRQLGPALAVLDARVAVPGFHARHAARWRRYRYDLLTTRWPDPLRGHFAWHVPAELDLAAMRIAGDALLGEHDFAAFCRRPPGPAGPITRRVLATSWAKVPGDGDLLRFEITANAFCHQMVRSLVGTIVAVGEGRLPAGELFAILRSADRARGSRLAPPHGLSLVAVGYPEELVPNGSWVPGRPWPADRPGVG